MPTEEQVLSLSLRPKSLKTMVGQEKLLLALQKQVEKRLPRAFMLHGPTGTGKTTLARIIAYSLQCTHKPFGSPCASCWEQEWLIHEINASEDSGVADAARVADISRHAPLPPSRYRVLILDEIQRTSTAAQNLLLKPFEEAGPHCVWIICTTEPTKVLPALRSRCMEYSLRGLGIEASELLLKRAAKKAGLARKEGLEPLFSALHEAHITSPRMLLLALEKYASGLSATEAAGEVETKLDTYQICRAVTGCKLAELAKLLKDSEPSDAYAIRFGVLGYLRGFLNRGDTSPRVLDSMMDLTTDVPYDEKALLFWLTPRLFRVAKRFGRR